MAVNLSTSLPWQQLESQANAFQGLGGDPQQALAALGQNYGDAYRGALNLNAGIYQGTQTGYENLRSSLDDQYSTVFNSYAKNYGDVLGMIAGTNASNLRDIDTNYTALSGKTSQDMINRGLGNSTVQGNMQRAIALDRERARTNSQNQFSQLQAGYANQIGQNFINSQERAAGAKTALGSEQLRFGASVNAPYPNADFYSRMAQMYGAQKAGDNRSSMEKLGMGGPSGNWYTAAGPGMQPKPSGYDYRSVGTNYGGMGGGGGGGGSPGFGGFGNMGAPQQNFDAMFDTGGWDVGYAPQAQFEQGTYPGFFDYASDVAPGSQYADEQGGMGYYDDPGAYQPNYYDTGEY